MPKLFDNLRSRLSSKKGNQSKSNSTAPSDTSSKNEKTKISMLETDAAPVSDDNDSDIDDDYNEQSRTSSISSQISNLNSFQRQESLPPLKEHRIVEATRCNSLNNSTPIDFNSTHQQLVPSSNFDSNNHRVIPAHATLNQTQAQTIYQISHASGVHIGNVISINSATQNNTPIGSSNTVADAPSPPIMGLRKSSSQSSNGYTITKTINEMSKSNLVVDEKFIDIISEHLINWKDIARKLDYTEGQIDHFYMDNHVYGTKETVYQMLLDWMRNAYEPTLGILTKILWRNNNQEAVIQLKPLYKAKKIELQQKANDTTNDN